MIRCLAPFVMCLLVGCSRPDSSMRLVGWPNGTHDAYDIEVPFGEVHFSLPPQMPVRWVHGQAVVIPDVLSIHTTERFVIGKADWKYIGGYWKSSTGGAITNEFWFALDKRSAYPKCYALITTNAQQWIAWCASHAVSSKLLGVNRFVRFAETNRWKGGDHRL
jgi:hypothetical protein